MDRVALIEIAESLLVEYRDLLIIDPFFRIKIEIVEDQYVSKCLEDSLVASWIIKLNPSQHHDNIDVQTSILEALLQIQCRHLPHSKEREEVISRLTVAFANLLPADTDYCEAEDNE